MLPGKAMPLWILLAAGTLGACQTILGISGDPPGGEDVESRDLIEDFKLRPNDPGLNDFFGGAVAVDGDTIVVGSEQEDPGGQVDSGAAYVFVRRGDGWEQQGKLVANDGVSSDHFGAAVALSGDTALIGAPRKQNGSGAAYVFVREGENWSQQAKVTREVLVASDFFGTSVALEGDTALVGAFRSSAAFVFTREGATWTEQAKLDSGKTGDEFGLSVSLSGDSALVGAAKDDPAGTDSGSAYVFVRSGSEWTLQANLVASDVARGDRFGLSVALSGEGAMIGAPLRNDAGDGAGAIYFFERNQGVWSQEARLVAEDPGVNDFFGSQVSLDGDRALVGVALDDDDGDRSGSAYLFQRVEGSWVQQAKLRASDAASGDDFGDATALDGESLVVGATLDDDNFSAAGSVYVFER